jgi:hypothetical protein
MRRITYGGTEEENNEVTLLRFKIAYYFLVYLGMEYDENQVDESSNYRDS